MSFSIFDYDDYKKYLADLLGERPNGGRGERVKISKALSCNIAYVSKVLNDSAHFSAEQAEALSRYLNLVNHETDYFILLVMFARAGTKSLQDYYRRKIDEARQSRFVLKERLKVKKNLSAQDQSVYYSSWYYSAVHLLTGIPSYQTKEALSARLSLPVKKVSEVLEFLESCSLVTKQGQRYQRTSVTLHLGNDSPMISKHHMNWRLQAMRSLDRDEKEAIHYSSAVTIAASDLSKIKEILIQAIEQVRSRVRASKDEELYCYSLDLYKA